MMSFFGEKNPNAKLRENQVLEILAKRKTGFSVGKLVKDYGISYSAIERIIYGKAWSHIPRNVRAMKIQRRFITASTGTVLLQEYQPVSCAWKTVLFLKEGTRGEKLKKAEAWLAAKVPEKIYEVFDTRTGEVVARAESEEAAKLKRQAFTRALIKVDAGKGFYAVRVAERVLA